MIKRLEHLSYEERLRVAVIQLGEQKTPWDLNTQTPDWVDGGSME